MLREDTTQIEYSDLGFQHRYRCEVLPGLPGTGPLPLQFAAEGQRTHSEGTVVRVWPDKAPTWLGNFQKGPLGGISGAYGCPSDTCLCVVSKGQGYFINVENPEEYEIVGCIPILGVLRPPGRGLLVFSNATELIAYGEKGVAWMTEQLSYDGLRVTEVTNDLIRGAAWDAPLGSDVGFEVEVSTGKHRGGAKF